MTEQELINRFTYHPPKGDQVERYQEIRDMGLTASRIILELTPDSREQRIALTHIDEAVMAANAAIARNE